jgi:hypothetical protein
VAPPGRTPLPNPLDRDQFWTIFPADLVQDLLITYIEKAHPMLFGPLHLLGVLDEQMVLPAPGDDARLPYTQRRLRWDRLVTIVSDPESLPRDVYGWGSTFDHGKLLLRLEAALRALGVLAGRQLPAGELMRRYYSGDPPANLRLLRTTLLPRGGMSEAGCERGNWSGELNARAIERFENRAEGICLSSSGEWGERAL